MAESGVDESNSTDLLSLLNNNIRCVKISTGCNKLDELLNGGVQCGGVTELYGEAGTGKTQCILQLSVNLSSSGRLAVILDTEGKIFPQRIQQIISSSGLADEVMSRILVRRCRTLAEFISTINILPSLVQSKSEVGGVFIDSIAHLFRYTHSNQQDQATNPGIQHGVCASLNDLAHTYNIPVVLTNQVTFNLRDDGGKSELIPTLGEAWQHAPTTRIMLKHQSLEAEGYELGYRIAVIEKSSSLKAGSIPFRITSCGIRDCVSSIVGDS